MRREPTFTISYPHPFQEEKIRRERIIDNGLPCLRWDDFKLLRVALSKQYKADQRDAAAYRATAAAQHEVMSWPPEFAEHQGMKTAVDNAVITDKAEQAAKERLQVETPITHGELLALIRDAGLKPTATRRASKVRGADQRVKAWVFGAYVHSPKTGLTNLTKQRPWLTRELARCMSTKSLEPFTSIVVADNLVFARHQDRNCADYGTTISGLSKFQGGKGIRGRHVHPDRDPIPGQRHRVDAGRSVLFRGTGWHGTEP